MPQFNNLVVTDRATPTPVNHTFTPQAIAGAVATLVESTGVPLADKRFTVSLQQNGGGKYKARLVLNIPVVETAIINGLSVPKVTRNAIADLTFTFEASSTEQERKDLVGMLMSALDPAKTLVNDTVTKLQGIY